MPSPLCRLSKHLYVILVILLIDDDNQSKGIKLISLLICSEGCFIINALDIFSAAIAGCNGRQCYIVGSI